MKNTYIAPLISVLLTLLFLLPVQIMVDPPMLLAERFLKGSGWVEIALLAAWAGFITTRVQSPGRITPWRTRYWSIFSFVFFTQFILGLLVSEKFLMSGDLHLPVPALIIAGPIFRGSGFFMIILLLSSMVLIGPGWCSHLCYIGAWDHLLASKKRPVKLNRKRTLVIRYAMLAMTVLLAIILRVAGASLLTAGIAAALFGVLGVAIMFLFSLRYGYMTHCTRYCPVGGLTVFLGKILPFRIRIDKSSCTLCGKCSMRCNYDALSMSDIEKYKAGWNCTLCGDCLDSCAEKSITLSSGKGKRNLWPYYIAVAIAIHAVSLGLARL